MPPSNPMDAKKIGKRLCDLRRDRGLTVKALALRAGVPVPSMECYLAGRNRPGADALIRLATALDIQVQWLLVGDVFKSVRRAG